MNRFYLNECLGGTFTCQELMTAFVKLISAFSSLAQKNYLHIHKGWVLEKEARKIVLGGISLENIIRQLPNREIKKLFYSYTLNYPIGEIFTKYDDEDLLQANYTFEQEDATNMAIVSKNGGILLTLPVSKTVRKDDLTIKSNHPDFKEIKVPNLHGETAQNVDATERRLLRKNYDEAPNGINKLSYLAPHVIMSDTFQKRFENAPTEHIGSIFDRLDEILTNHLLQPLQCNGTMISHVAEHVSELRVVNPVDIRIYFHEHRDTIYLAKMALKSEYVAENAQTKDIKEAENIILQLMRK